MPGVVTTCNDDQADEGLHTGAVAPADGISLSVLMQQAGVLDMARGLRLAIELGEILEAGHNMGLVHGDLRPDNVLVVGDDERVVMLAPAPPPLTGGAIALGPGMLPGVPVPEQADVFAFGVILYQLLAGVGPFHFGKPEAGQVARAPVPLRKRRKEVPLPLERLVMQTLAPAPEHRPRDMSEVVTRLWIERERLRGGCRPWRLVGHAGPWPRQHRRLGAVAAVFLFFFTGSWFIGSWHLRASREVHLASLPAPEVTVPPRIATRPESAPVVPVPPIDSPRPATSEFRPAAPARPPLGARAPRASLRAGDTPAEAPIAPPAPPASAVGNERVAMIQPAPLVPAPPGSETPPPVGPRSPQPADVTPAPVPSGPSPETAASAGGSPPALPVASPLPARHGAGDVAAVIEASPRPRHAVAPERVPQASAPAPDAESVPAPIPAPETELAAGPRRSSFRGAPPPGSEAGPSSLDQGHGARGAGGMIEGRLRLSSRDLGEQPVEPSPGSGRASAAGFFDKAYDTGSRR